MPVILEIIGEMMVQIIFEIPGAFIRWLLTGGKKSFREVLCDNSSPNVFIGVIVVVLCVAIATWIGRG